MQHPDIAIVTGAFSYPGRYVARRLLDEGINVRSLTNRPERDEPFGGQVPAVHLRRPGAGGSPEAAAGAGVGRMVHFSVANASTDSRLPYFRGKGQVEEILRDTGILPYAIIRPTLVFGEWDLLLNNMAWALRLFPVFPVFGKGDYPVQPIFAGDLAAQAVESQLRNEQARRSHERRRSSRREGRMEPPP